MLNKTINSRILLGVNCREDECTVVTKYDRCKHRDPRSIDRAAPTSQLDAGGTVPCIY